MPFRVLAFALLSILTLSHPAVAAEPGDQVATIIELEGAGTVTRSDTGAREALAVNSVINQNDVINTGTGAKAFVQFIDGTEITLSENTQLRADEFAYDPDNVAENKAVYSILQGTFLYTSGLVAKKPNPDVTVNTSYGSIGIRGTTFWGGPIDGSYGVLVNDGAVTVKNGAGEVNLDKGQGTSLASYRALPGEVKVWGQQKIDRAVATVTLKDPGVVRDRISKREAVNKRLVGQRKILLRERVKGGPGPRNAPIRNRIRSR